MGNAASNPQVSIALVATSDVHGNIFPHHFIKGKESRGSMARVMTYVDNLRKMRGHDNVVLLDNGDILQGQPVTYYFNFIDTASVHLVSRMYGFMGYDAATVGNHDLETGRPVYDRWISTSSTPVVCANIIDKRTGQPYLNPYVVLQKGGKRIAVLGLITPAIPGWLPENLWHGLEFEDMAHSARKWLKVIEEKEHPDAIVGLFHSGALSPANARGIVENASVSLAENVPGFNAIFIGHDHKPLSSKIKNIKGSEVLVLNPGANATNVAMATLTFDNEGGLSVEGSVESVESLTPSQPFLNEFGNDFNAVQEFVERIVGWNPVALSSRGAYFGATPFMQLLHELQLEISGADLSLAAPTSFQAVLGKGPLSVADMFSLYHYENMLYVMSLSGKEINDYLEYSYSLWLDDEKSPHKKHLLAFATYNAPGGKPQLKNPYFNFDSAFGIDYTVDIFKPAGERVKISGFSDGRPFSKDSIYKVAVNSYRGNGGGEHLTKGAGIAPEQLNGRIMSSTDKDLRYYLMKNIEKHDTIKVKFTRNWKFIPESRTGELARADSFLLFGAKNH